MEKTFTGPMKIPDAPQGYEPYSYEPGHPAWRKHDFAKSKNKNLTKIISLLTLKTHSHERNNNHVQYRSFS